jgi:hypothetical protein
LRAKITITEKVAPGQPRVILYLGNLKLPFSKAPNADETVSHEVEISAREVWRVEGLRSDGYSVEEIAEAKKPAQNTEANSPEKEN